MSKIVIIGAGAMGSAFAVPCADNSNEVFLVGSFLEDKVINEIKHLNNFHPILKSQLPNKIKVLKFSEFKDEIKDNIDLLVVGVSSKGIEWIGNEISKFYNSSIDILLLTKGLALINDKFETLAEKLNDILKKEGIDNAKISAVGGPCLANGLVNRINSSVVLANQNIDVVKKIGSMISTNYYSTEYSDDLIGVEVCAATKNIYSILIGASEGLSSNNLSNEIKKKYFLNTAASLAYKAISEMKVLSKRLHGKEETAYGLAGLGDLYVSSAGGRNSKMGYYLGQGYVFTEAKEKFMKEITVEGADLAFAIGQKILKEFKKEEFPLLISVIEAICENKKLEIKW
ncbi:glycerol-3-phosphate dehydrogenase [Candidatus Pelagibacter sp.]|nr:glycerol-3-phosphate dehydrogenase [Candidatus Pelagibacter sp.]